MFLDVLPLVESVARDLNKLITWRGKMKAILLTLITVTLSLPSGPVAKSTLLVTPFSPLGPASLAPNALFSGYKPTGLGIATETNTATVCVFCYKSKIYDTAAFNLCIIVE